MALEVRFRGWYSRPEIVEVDDPIERTIKDTLTSITNAFGLSQQEDNDAAEILRDFLQQRGGTLTPRNTRRGAAFARDGFGFVDDGISTSAPGAFRGRPAEPRTYGNLQVGRGNTGGLGQQQTILTGMAAQRRSDIAIRRDRLPPPSPNQGRRDEFLGGRRSGGGGSTSRGPSSRGVISGPRIFYSER